MEAIDPRWRKASYSDNGGNCIEVGTTTGSVVVRDTKDHGNGPVLAFGRQAWEKFAVRVKADVR